MRPARDLRSGALMGWEKVSQWVGLAAAFYIARQLYRLFASADHMASAPLKQAISAWLKREPLQRVDWQSAILGMMFDRVYTYPLLRPKAFVRSTAISIGAFILFVFMSASNFSCSAIAIVSPYLVSVVLSDYISLFVVRRALLFSNRYPIASLLASSLLGSIVITIVFFFGLEFQKSFITSPHWCPVNKRTNPIG
jgi:hypothetical protein